MIGLLQYFDLAVGSLGVGGMLKSIKYFFESVNFFCRFFLHFPYMAVGAGAYFFDYVKTPEDMTLNIGSVRLGHEV